MEMKKEYGFGTRAIHAGNKKDTQYGALTTPIYQTSTFVFEDCKQGGNRFAGEESGFIYSRLGNPTSSVLEEKIANLEGGEAAAVTSSGMGAITSALWTICKAGDHIIADGTLYGCTFAYLSHGISRYGVEVTFLDTSDLEALKAALRPNTKVVYLETPANPNLKITDIRAVSDLVHGFNPEIKVVCDNTFATPYLQRPLELGADVVVHSATKYLNGHGDVIAGVVVGKADYIAEVRLFGIKDMTGSVLGPFESFLILRGLKTMEIRMDRHCESAQKVAEFLKDHPAVESISFPGLPEHPGYEVAKKQMLKPGAMISFEVKGGRANGAKLLDSLEMCALAVSLGDAETLIEHPASMTHSPYSAEELEEVGISEGLVRLSVGLENVEDIIADLKQGLDQLTW
ncbi:methionine gamma-lyase [Anaerotignum lactatifermentans]|uniref:L-methionine gamma-lyase n=1 Tax=Anaerotignum lactatifermentans TaxID=160404 RepID=A0ABS2G6Y6_9FIRM|nr:methionine gamma-lyase [Anaerotignum lactatifermentans]MBM6828877.1 methionine gamma-lyase [Anaerotignum lactatifermentans]MBM6876950.1 methionine gamma-lyase [Anaerotignum lactatifermentans]MBM6950508.1 methionine gamma-lyase [Anaerotignum lactatifermentans]